VTNKAVLESEGAPRITECAHVADYKTGVHAFSFGGPGKLLVPAAKALCSRSNAASKSYCFSNHRRGIRRKPRSALKCPNENRHYSACTCNYENLLGEVYRS